MFFTFQIEKYIYFNPGLNTLSKHNEVMSGIRYSVGGLYNIHHDADNDVGSLVEGRFLTWLTYLDDVEAGGATVFPKYNVTVFPEKYSSIYWHNYLNSGVVNEGVLHTGCPVLFGEKWIALKGLRVRGQTHDKCLNLKNRNEFRFLQRV